MTKWNYVSVSALALAICAGDSRADAQSIGTFKWQLQPYCNVVTLAVTQVDGVYRLEGTDDQCGNGSDQASAIGTAFQNPDGTIGFGLTIVATPGGVPVHVDAALAPGGFDGTWKDNAGNSGAFRFTAGASSGGNARPLPAPAEVPRAIHLSPGGSLVAEGVAGEPMPQSNTPTKMLWHGAKGAFRAGYYANRETDDVNIGVFSAAFGQGTTASGFGSVAFGGSSRSTGDFSAAIGERATASGFAAMALGRDTRATALASTAFGANALASGIASVAGGDIATAAGRSSVSLGSATNATGNSSVALGLRAAASGDAAFAAGNESVASGTAAAALGERAAALGGRSFAAGYLTTAAGNFSVVLGSNARTTAAGFGSFVFGDGSAPGAQLESAGPNEFVSRFGGGYYLFSNTALTAGVRVLPGANAWSSLSDVRSKENFRELAADDILAKIAAMPVREWNYKSQDAAIRHMGPTAQDFHAAFGLGEDPLRISTIDADGVALAAVKALEARSRTRDAATREEIEALRAELAMLRSLVTARLAAPQ